MPELADKGSAIAAAPDVLNLPGKMPRIPGAVLERFPDMEDYQKALDKWWSTIQTSLGDLTQDTAQVVNNNYTGVKNLFVSVDGLTAEITEISEVVVTGFEAVARRIVTVSAMAGINSRVTVSPVAPGAPLVNDYWIDTTVPLTPVTKQWSGAAWVEVTTPISAAGVQTEATARATADGFLSGKYTLTVTAGNVVTGMNITSSSGGGTNISDVTFVASNFKIYNGAVGVTMFEVSGATVNLAGTLTVSTSGKVFIGVGTFNNTNTAFYVDSSGQFSLKDKLSWDGTTLSITGVLNSSSGTIGGFTLGASSLTGGSGTTRVILNTTGSLGSGIVMGDYGAATTTMQCDHSGYYVFEDIFVLAELRTTGSAGSRGGFLELWDTTGTVAIALNGALGQINTPKFVVGTYAGSPALSSGESYFAGSIYVNTATATPGYGNSDTGFYIEAGTSAMFASRADNFAGSYNRNDDGALVLFSRSGTQVGSVSVNTTNTAYNTSSDRRLKKNILPAPPCGDLIDRIQIRNFEFNVLSGHTKIGVIAQELFEVYPDAVTAGDGDEKISQPWGVDYSKLVPVMLREIQDLRSRVKALEA